MKFRSDLAKQVYSLLNDSADIDMPVHDETADEDTETPYISIKAPLTDGMRLHAFNKDDASGAYPKVQIDVWDDSPKSSLIIKEKLDSVDDVVDHSEISLGQLTSIPNQSGIERDPSTGDWHGYLRYEITVEN